jgi:hypothetical protein
MKRQLVARFLSVVLAASGLAIWFAPNVHGLPPLRQGWWSKWQQPTATLTTLPITVPPPPGSETGGLTIALEPSGPAAVAALEFSVEVGADATMYLDIAPGHQPPLPSGAEVHMCLATSTWHAESNGKWSDAPSWDQCAAGAANRAQPGFVFTLSPSMQKEDGTYNVVIVPGGNQPFVLNFAATSNATLAPGEPPQTTTTSTTTTTAPPSTTTTPTTEPKVEVTDPVVVTDIPGTPGRRSLPPSTTTTTAAPRRTATSLVAFDPGSGIVDALPIPDSRMERIMAVSLLFFMAVALWWLGGSPARMPRLIGALGGGSRPAPSPTAAARGVGRFARPRAAGRVPRL